VDQPRNTSKDPLHVSKWSNDSVQDKGIERGIECIGFEGFDEVRIKRFIGVSRGGVIHPSYTRKEGLVLFNDRLVIFTIFFHG